MKRFVLPLLLVGFGIFGVTCADDLGRAYAVAYPSDPPVRQAIENCAAESPAFNRLDPAEHRDCLVHQPMLRGAEMLPELAPPRLIVQPTALDSGGRMPPRNDIRRLQATQAYEGH